MNRKLIRPDLNDLRGQLTSRTRVRKPPPPEHTSAESYYYAKQMANRTRMVVVLKDGEEIHGIIEWYDRYAIKIHRASEPNILLMKENVKYMYKENEVKGEDDE